MVGEGVRWVLKVLCLLVDGIIIVIFLGQELAFVIFDALLLSLFLAEAFIFVSTWTGKCLLGFDFIAGRMYLLYNQRISCCWSYWHSSLTSLYIIC
jgi:hypothetical protein